MSVPVIGRQGSHLCALSKSHEEGWSFTVSHFQEHKRGGRFLNYHCFQECRAHGKFNIVHPFVEVRIFLTHSCSVSCRSFPTPWEQESAQPPPLTGLALFPHTRPTLTPGSLLLLASAWSVPPPATLLQIFCWNATFSLRSSLSHCLSPFFALFFSLWNAQNTLLIYLLYCMSSH